MGFAWRDIEEAYLFTNAGPELGNSAVLCKVTGEIHYASEADEMTLPESVEGNDACIELPRRDGLDLGTFLLYEFGEERAPDLADQVRRLFSRKGASARFKDLMDQRQLLDAWHDFEDKCRSQALRRWCEDHGITVDR